MKTIFNFFLSFDKLMKEKLVKAFYWLGLIVIILNFGEAALRTIPFVGQFFASIIDFLGFFPQALLAIVALRLLCETLIAVFRINDNLSPDGGQSETADVDLLEEARKAAEIAASKAKEAATSATEKTKTAFDKTKDAAEKTAHTAKESATTARAKIKKTVNPEDITIEPPVKAKVVRKTATKKKSTAKKTTAKTKKAAPKKTTASKKTAKKTTPKKTTKRKTAAKKTPSK